MLFRSSKVWKFYGEASVGSEMAAQAEFSAMMDLESTEV